MNVRPPTVVATGHDGIESDLPIVVGNLHTAQPRLVRHAIGIHRVLAFGVAVPDVDRRADQRLIIVRNIHKPHRQRHGHTLDRPVSIDRVLQIPALNSRFVQDVWAVRTVARVRAGSLRVHLR